MGLVVSLKGWRGQEPEGGAGRKEESLVGKEELELRKEKWKFKREIETIEKEKAVVSFGTGRKLTETETKNPFELFRIFSSIQSAILL